MILQCINSRVWTWSLLAAGVLRGILFLLAGLFPRYYWLSFARVDGVPVVTPALVFSELGTELSQIYSHLWAWTLVIWLIVALFFYTLVGWWTARRTGALKTGLLAGFLAGLFYTLINGVLSSVQFIQFLQHYSSTGYDRFAAQMRAYTLTLYLVDTVSAFSISFLLFGLFAGLLGGFLGGLCGRRLRISPPQTSDIS